MVAALLALLSAGAYRQDVPAHPAPAPPTPSPAAGRPTLFLIGDSTVRNGRGDGANGQWGWGEPLAAFFDPARIELVNRVRLLRLVPGPDVLQSDVFTRGFTPSREEDAEVWLTDGSSVTGRVWMPLERPTQRISDFMNQRGREFFVLLQGREIHLVNAAAVARMAVAESAGAPPASRDSRIAEELSLP